MPSDLPSTTPAPPHGPRPRVTWDELEIVRWPSGWRCSDGTRQRFADLCAGHALGPGPYERAAGLEEGVDV